MRYQYDIAFSPKVVLPYRQLCLVPQHFGFQKLPLSSYCLGFNTFIVPSKISFIPCDTLFDGSESWQFHFLFPGHQYEVAFGPWVLLPYPWLFLSTLVLKKLLLSSCYQGFNTCRVPSRISLINHNTLYRGGESWQFHFLFPCHQYEVAFGPWVLLPYPWLFLSTLV